MVSSIQGFNQVIGFYDVNPRPQHVRFSEKYRDEIVSEVVEFNDEMADADLVAL